MSLLVVGGSVVLTVLTALVALGMIHKSWSSQNRNWERKEREWARERSELLDRLMHSQGNTWTPPPAIYEEPVLIEEAIWPEMEPVE